MKTVLKAKIKEIAITDASHEYEGSITLDENIMDKLGVCEYEQVYVHSKYKKGRIMTYFLAGRRGSKCCELNGGAVNHFAKGEVVHLLVFKQIYDNDSQKPIVL